MRGAHNSDLDSEERPSDFTYSDRKTEETGYLIMTLKKIKKFFSTFNL